MTKAFCAVQKTEYILPVGRAFAKQSALHKAEGLERDYDRDTLFSFEGITPKSKSGGDSKEAPPVPIPNTEVKLLSVDDTWRETARESRTLPEPRIQFETGFLAYIPQ